MYADFREKPKPLTAEQSARISSNFDIEVCTGLHGYGHDERYKGQPRLHEALPMQAEYETAAAVIEDMQPGDMLFVENHGFSHQPEPSPREFDPKLQALMGSAFTHVFHSQLQAARQQLKAQLEDDRHHYRIDAFSYAAGLARLRGVDIRYADLTAGEKEANRIFHGRDSLDMRLQPASSQAWHGDREEKVPEIIADWALKNLPPHNRAAGERKPKLKLLFGDLHHQKLRETFADKNLGAHFTKLGYEMDDTKRQQEQGIYLASQALQRTVSVVGTAAAQVSQIRPRGPGLIGASRVAGRHRQPDLSKPGALFKASGNAAGFSRRVADQRLRRLAALKKKHDGQAE